ncbi:putative monocarboxylate transporter [Aspergillus ambiguus]|uniref:putative monocarboxylate transporter n=1 Tax=Aspergillus ambiguus TaxID=176160 RepID=UPI003CCCEDE1
MPNADAPPNGGLRAWMATSGGLAVQICTVGYINSFGFFQSYYTDHLLPGYTPSAISWIGSLQGFLLNFFGILSGPLFDRFGIKAVIVPSGVVLVFSIMATSLSTRYYQLMLAQGLLGGIAHGMVFTPSISAVGQLFTTRRSCAVGIATIGSSVGGIILPIMMRELWLVVGFAWAIRIVGFVVLALIMYASLVMEDLAHARRRRRFFIPRAWSHPPYLLVNLGFLLALVGVYSPSVYIIDYSQSCGMTPSLAWYQVTIYNAASLIGRLILNLAGDLFGPFNVSIFTYIYAACSIFCWTAATTPAGIVVWISFYGFAAGAVLSIYVPVVAKVCPKPGDLGTYVGQGLAVCGLGVLAGTPATGALIHHYGYLSASMLCASTMLAGAFCLLAARFCLVKSVFAAV